jgi:Leucine-rich repeat (LRR) protein
MRLVELNLFGNKISEIDGLSKLPLLRKLDLSKN